MASSADDASGPHEGPEEGIVSRGAETLPAVARRLAEEIRERADAGGVRVSMVLRALGIDEAPALDPPSQRITREAEEAELEVYWTDAPGDEGMDEAEAPEEARAGDEGEGLVDEGRAGEAGQEERDERGDRDERDERDEPAGRDERQSDGDLDPDTLNETDAPTGLGRFHVRRELGHGGMGRVLEARDPELRRDVAIKLLINPSKVSTMDLARFVSEAQITAQLEHPNIVPVHDMGVTGDGEIFFVMKKIEGRSLRQVLRALARKHPDTVAEWTPHKLLSAFVQVCNAVAYAHDRGVLHRDLKPANIMLGAFGEVLVLDWGLAQLVGESRHFVTCAPRKIFDARGMQSMQVTMTLDGELLGTPGYMSPEYVRGNLHDLDGRADLWSSGASSSSGTRRRRRPPSRAGCANGPQARNSISPTGARTTAPASGPAWATRSARSPHSKRRWRSARRRSRSPTNWGSCSSSPARARRRGPPSRRSWRGRRRRSPSGSPPSAASNWPGSWPPAAKTTRRAGCTVRYWPAPTRTTPIATRTKAWRRWTGIDGGGVRQDAYRIFDITRNRSLRIMEAVNTAIPRLTTTTVPRIKNCM